jgi:hypothetical protein
MRLLITSFILVVFLLQFGARIDSPRPGDVLQGNVIIQGTSDIAGFLSAEISFAYADDPTGTWFLFESSQTTVIDGTLATWDTTTITDGNFDLRLRIFLTDGTYHDIICSGLRVRNYTPVETPTPLPTMPLETPIPSVTPTITPYPTPTLLHLNPAVVAPENLWASVGYGGMAVVLAFVFLGVYLWLRRK